MKRSTLLWIAGGTIAAAALVGGSSDSTPPPAPARSGGGNNYFDRLRSDQIACIAMLIHKMRAKGITNKYMIAAALAVMSKESAFKPQWEVGYGNASNERIRNIFGARVAGQSDSELTSLKQDDRSFFNLVYKKLGGYKYRGSGLIQLTGEDNYEKAEAALRKYYPEIVKEFEQRTGKKFDLTVGDQPNDAGDADNASDPAIAYAIMSFGMHTGMFTGRSLKSHTTAAGFDAYNARDIINADKKKNGRMIEGYYNKFLAILRASKISAAAAPMPVVAQLDETGHDPDLTSPTPDAQASPDVESTQTPTIENTINSEGDTTLLNKVDAAGNKWTAITATLEKFGIAIPDAKTSLGTWFMTGFKLLFSAIMAALGVVYDHWEYFLLAAVLLYLAYRLYNRSRDRVAQEKAGIPADILREAK